MKRCASTGDFFEDIVGFRSPNDGLRVGVMMLDIVFYCCYELVDRSKRSAADTFCRKIAKEPLNHVEPRCARRREVHVKPFVSREPTLHFVMLVGSIIVGDEMNFQVGGNALINQAKELQPLSMAMPFLARADDRSVKGVQRGKERCRSMAYVVVCHRCRATTLEWQTQLRTIQRLNLAFLVSAEHNGVFGWIEIQANDVSELLGEPQIVTELERLNEVGAEPVAMPNSRYGCRAYANGLRHRTLTPMRRRRRLLLSCFANDLLD